MRIVIVRCFADIYLTSTIVIAILRIILFIVHINNIKICNLMFLKHKEYKEDRKIRYCNIVVNIFTYTYIYTI